MSEEMGDISFRKNKRMPVHGWFGYVAGYDAGFVRSVIEEFCPPPEEDPVVFDPYCGSGTTLVEAIDSNRDAIGVEINPFMASVARTKTDWDVYSEDPQTQVRDFINDVRPQVLSRYPNQTLDSFGENAVTRADVEIKAKADVPELANVNKWYTDSVLEQLRILKGNIKLIKNESLKSLARLAFASILVDVSNGGYDPSLSYRRDSDGDVIQNEANVARAFEDQLSTFASDLETKVGEREGPYGDALVVCSDGEEHPALSDGIVDILVTSPPYANNMNYIRQTRPHLYWLDYWADRSRRQFEDAMMGSYWQIVRKEEVEMEYPTETLEEVIEKIRQQEPEREELGGPGWARYVIRYFNDTGHGFEQHYRMLKPDGVATYVVGNSVIKDVNVPVGEILAEMVEKHFDFEVEMAPQISTNKRVGSSLRTEELNDVVVTLRKPE